MTSLQVTNSTSPPPQPTELLSDDQIEALIQEAEARLRGDTDSDALALKPAEEDTAVQAKLPQLQHDLNGLLYVKDHNGVAKIASRERTSANKDAGADELRHLENASKSKKVNDQTTSGPQWFEMPKTELTPSLKRDLQLIEMRSVLDPHRHYKKNTRRGKIPSFSQVGTVIEGPTEWYSSRINKKDRSKNFVEEVMKIEQDNGRMKRKYTEIQESKTSGKKTHYKKLMQKRRKNG